ncbi:YfhO family protein [Candidatus Gottesmanbacteria bacterium]|nr:YfhO family protein [Candidatus Gottesmanbacteria bacterium]
MKRNEWMLVLVILSAVISLFFYQTVFRGKVPFPGDILVSDFQPWRSTSYLGYGAGGIPNKAQYPDTIRQMYPWKTAVINSLQKGRLPLWNPYNFSGSPLLANFQSAAVYPLGILYLFMAQIDAWTILVITQPLLAVLFTYLFSRKIGMRPLGSWLAATSYGFSGFMAVWLEYNTIGHVVLWLPLILLAIEHLRERISPLWLGIYTLSHVMSLLAGHPQVYAYACAFSVTYGLFRMHRTMWPYLLGFTALGIGIAGIQVVPGMELVSHAARSPHDPGNLFAKILIHPGQLFALPFPNLFGNPATRTYWPSDTFVGKVTTIGLIPLFFSLSALRRKDTISKWFILAVLTTALLLTTNPITQILYRVPIPLFTSSSPTLMSFLLAFSLSMMCGLGLDFWMRDKHSLKKLFRRTIEVAGIFAVLFIGTKLPFTPELSLHAGVAVRALIYGMALSAATLGLFWIAIALPKMRTLAITVLLVIHVMDLFVFFNRFNPFVSKELVFPEHKTIAYLSSAQLGRYWGYGTANISANFASQYRLFSPEGYDPLYPKWYGEFLYAYRNGQLMEIFDNASRSDAAISSRFGDGGLSDETKRKVLSALSVRYILDRMENASSEQTYPPHVIKKIHSFDDWAIYENTEALPRAFVAGESKTYENSRDFTDIFFSDGFNPITTALFPEGVSIVKGFPATGSAAITSYEPERVMVKTESSVSGTLVVTDTFYPGWIATVDGKPTAIARVNWTMRGINVPSGKHEVIMIYAPFSVTLGILLSAASLGATIILLLIIQKKRL